MQAPTPVRPTVQKGQEAPECPPADSPGTLGSQTGPQASAQLPGSSTREPGMSRCPGCTRSQQVRISGVWPRHWEFPGYLPWLWRAAKFERTLKTPAKAWRAKGPLHPTGHGPAFWGSTDLLRLSCPLPQDKGLPVNGWGRVSTSTLWLLFHPYKEYFPLSLNFQGKEHQALGQGRRPYSKNWLKILKRKMEMPESLTTSEELEKLQSETISLHPRPQPKRGDKDQGHQRS